RCRDPPALPEARASDRPPIAPAVPRCRRPRRQLLPEHRRVGRPHRRTRGRDLPEGRREPAPRDLPDEATPRRDAEDRDAEDEHYFRDVYDHLIRISDLIDSYRDFLTGAMDVYLSTVSNRINAVMKQLTIIATIFLPLTFITGFFGQNFDWMVSHVHSWPMFLVLGVGSEIVALLALLAFFRRRGWF